MDPCTVVLTKGLHKGQICGSIAGQRCHHRTDICNICGKLIKCDKSFYRHAAKCQPKIKLTVKAKDEKRHDDLVVAKLKILEEEVEKLKKPQIVNINADNINVINNIVNNFHVVVGDNFFVELVDKIGKPAALEYISHLVDTNKPIELISKLYLDGNSPDDYPIACKEDDHFRYINSAHEIIDDVGGHQISHIVNNGIQNAMILAVNEYICQKIERNVDKDYDNIMKVQTYAMDMQLPKEYIVDSLAARTTNPNHPFFNGRLRPF